MEFLVLTYCGMIVDEGMLEKGIYQTTMPRLHKKGATIGGMILASRFSTDMHGKPFIPDSYRENLAKCTLTQFVLTQVITPTIDTVEVPY